MNTCIICASPVALVLSWKQLLPDVEHSDLQGLCNGEIHVSEVCDMACDSRSFENSSEQKSKLPLMGYYAVSSGGFLLRFQENLMVPFSGFKNPKNSEDGTSRLS